MPKKDYAKKKYANPLREKAPKEKRLSKSSRGLIATGVAVLVLAGAFYALLVSPLLRVNKIEITGSNDPEITHQIKQWLSDQAGERYLKIIPGDNLSVINSKKLKQVLSNDKYIDSVVVAKILPDKLSITIKEKKSSLVYEIEGKKYLIDANGDTVDVLTVPDELSAALPLILGTSTDQLASSGAPEFNSGLVEFISDLSRELPKYKDGILLNHFELIPKTSGIKAYTSLGWYIMFDTSSDLHIQLSNFKRTYDEMISDEEKNSLEYIDVRLINYIYYK